MCNERWICRTSDILGRYPRCVSTEYRTYGYERMIRVYMRNEHMYECICGRNRFSPLTRGFFCCVLCHLLMTTQQEQAFEEAKARAAAYQSNSRAFAIKYGRNVPTR